MSHSEGFGLPIVEFRVDHEDVEVMNSTTWEKTPVGADVRIDGFETRADIKFRR